MLICIVCVTYFIRMVVNKIKTLISSSIIEWVTGEWTAATEEQPA